MLKNVEYDVKFDVENDNFQRPIFFQRHKYDVKNVKHFTCRTNDEDPPGSDG